LTAGTATNATNTAITNDVATATTVYPTWVTANTGNLPQKVSSTKLWFNPSSGALNVQRLNISAGTTTSSYYYNNIALTGTFTTSNLTNPTIQSDITNSAIGHIVQLDTASTTVITNVYGYRCNDVTLGSVSASVTNNYGFYIPQLINASNNYGFYATSGGAVGIGKNTYGFYSSIDASGAGTVWNFYSATTAPNYFGGNVGIGRTPSTNLDVNGSFALSAPSLTNASTYTVATTDVSLRFTTTACTVTLPAAASFTGRILYLNNVTAIAVTSASSNVIPLGSNTAGTAILAATAGKFAMIQSNGTNWITMMAN
jgi:hypothetical protein